MGKFIIFCEYWKSQGEKQRKFTVWFQGFALIESLVALLIISVSLLALGATSFMTMSSSLLFSQSERSYQVARRALDLVEAQAETGADYAQIENQVEAEEPDYSVTLVPSDDLSGSGGVKGVLVAARAVKSSGVKDGEGVTLTRYFSANLSSHAVSRDSR